MAALSSSLTPPLASATPVGDVEHERPIGLELVRSLLTEHGDRGCERVNRPLDDLVRGGDEPESRCPRVRELADELALALAMRGEVRRDGLRLAEAVREVTMCGRHEQTRARDALLEVVPLVLCEVRLACHVCAPIRLSMVPSAGG